MESLIINSTFDIPKVELDVNANCFKISMRSLPENATSLYAPILSWLQQYSNNPNKVTNFQFHFELLSSSSMKQVMKIIALLNDIATKSTVNIFWMYDKDDTDMLYTGESFQRHSNIKFSFQEV